MKGEKQPVINLCNSLQSLTCLSFYNVNIYYIRSHRDYLLTSVITKVSKCDRYSLL